MTDLVFIAGLLLAVGGVALLSIPAALIVGGVATAATALWFEASA